MSRSRTADIALVLVNIISAACFKVLVSRHKRFVVFIEKTVPVLAVEKIFYRKQGAYRRLIGFGTASHAALNTDIIVELKYRRRNYRMESVYSRKP